MEEVQGTQEQNRQLTKEAIISDLVDRAIAASSMPINKKTYMEIHGEELNKKAEQIIKLGEEDKNITYEEAIDRAEEQSRTEKAEQEKQEEGQKIPGQKRGTY